jgi:hypothetical protein
MALRAARQALFDRGRATVLTPVEDLLLRPEPNAPLADQALLGDTLKVLPEQGSTCELPTSQWIEIETAAGYRGFIAASSLRPLAPDQRPYADSGPLLHVVTRLASLYEKPDVTSQKPFLLIPMGSTLRLAEASRNMRGPWQAIVLPGGRAGFVQSGDVESVPLVGPPSAACVVSQALRYLGTPYLWGGRSTLGIDCSGLVSNAFLACGVITPRDAGPQFRWPRLMPLPKDTAELRSGDLVFFGESRDSAAPKITHVGIYTTGGRFVHATTHEHPVVQESSLSEPYWTERWVGARRYPFESSECLHVPVAPQGL